MARNPRLDQAVAIFTELGWADASYADAPTLPLGTDAQRKAALAGLRSGEWGDVTLLDERRWGWRAYVDVDLTMLWLFAVCVGVDARRAATVSWREVPEDSAFAVLAKRGAEFARAFVKHHRRSMSSVAVRLVAHHQMQVPQDRQYLEYWTVGAASVLRESPPDVPLLAEEAVEDRFLEHVRAGVSSGLEAVGALGLVVPAGVARGWLDRDEAVALVLAALDAAGRPGDRKVWLTVWLDELRATDVEILAKAEALDRDWSLARVKRASSTPLSRNAGLMRFSSSVHPSGRPSTHAATGPSPASVVSRTPDSAVRARSAVPVQLTASSASPGRTVAREAGWWRRRQRWMEEHGRAGAPRVGSDGCGASGRARRR